MDKLQEIIGDYSTFVELLLAEVEDLGFDVNDLSQIDHLCYRTNSVENYAAMQESLEEVGTLLAESMVGGRIISTYRLHEPIYHDIWRIDAIELPAPKHDNSYTEGLEHLEFVIYDDIPTFLQKYVGKPFDLQSIDREINPEIGLLLGDYSVKFHLLSLPAAIFIEEKLGIDEII